MRNEFLLGTKVSELRECSVELRLELTKIIGELFEVTFTDILFLVKNWLLYVIKRGMPI